MTAYYNEIDPFAAQWLRNLIEAGHIAPGDVDERSIMEIKPNELKQYKQCHFFAGIGAWSYALRRAGWGDSRPVWTGSCPCQPFSAAGKGKGTEDERHLWPTWFELVSECQPAVIFGEQVASSEVIGKSDGTGENVWIDIVQTDMERASYTFAPFDLPAAGFGAPHLRQRLWFVANRLGDGKRERLEGYSRDGDRGDQPGRIETNSVRSTSQAGSNGSMGNAGISTSERDARELCETETESNCERRSDGRNSIGYSDAGEAGSVGNANRIGRQQQQVRARGSATRMEPKGREPEFIGETIGCSGSMADPDGRDASPKREQRSGQHGQQQADSSSSDIDRPAGPTNGFWRDSDWLGCRDNKFRPVEPGTFPLANGATQRVGRLRAYGNAICPEVAAGFIGAYLDSI